MFEYVDFLYFDFRGINETALLRTKSTVQQR